MEQVIFIKTSDGKLFADAADAQAYETALTRGKEVEAFVAPHFPAKEGGRANPHASTAVRAILLWLAAQEAKE